MEIKVYKLISGEEIIAEVTADGKVQNPLKVMHTPQGIALVPWSLLGDGSIPVELLSTVATYPPSEQARTEYMRLVTGIEVAHDLPSSANGLILEA